MTRYPPAGELFQQELLAALPTEVHSAVLRVFLRWGGATIHLPAPSATERKRRRHRATVMLRSGYTQADAVRALAERFEISKRHARRIVREAGQDLKVHVRFGCDASRS
jgi:Mor family transcriptional regulator